MSWPRAINLCPATEAQNLYKARTGSDAVSLEHCCFLSEKTRKRVRNTLRFGGMLERWRHVWRKFLSQVQGVIQSWLNVAMSATETGSGTSPLARNPARSRPFGSICCSSGQQGRAVVKHSTRAQEQANEAGVCH